MKFISQVALVRRAPSAALPALAFFLLGGKVKAISQAPLFWSRLSFSIFAQYCNVILSFPFFFPTGKGAKKLGKKRCEKTRVEDKLLQELIYLFNVEVCPLCVKRIRAVGPDGAGEKKRSRRKERMCVTQSGQTSTLKR